MLNGSDFLKFNDLMQLAHKINKMAASENIQDINLELHKYMFREYVRWGLPSMEIDGGIYGDYCIIRSRIYLN